MSIKALKDISYPLTIVYFRNVGVFLVVGAMIFEIERLSGLHSCFGRESFSKAKFFFNPSRRYSIYLFVYVFTR